MNNYLIHKFTGNKSAQQKRIIQEAVNIASALGIPVETFRKRQVRRVERLGLVLLALGDMTPDTPWKGIKSKESGTAKTSREIIGFLNEHYAEVMKSSSYDDFKRKEIDFLVMDSIVVPGTEISSTNDSRSGYSICPIHAAAMKEYGQFVWDAKVQEILDQKDSLREMLDTTRKLASIPVILPDGLKLNFSPGIHNELQKAIIEQFLPIYGFGAKVLYVGDSIKKYLHLDSEALMALRFPEPSHEELPDVIAVSDSKKWVYLIEAVTSFGEITPIRKLELEKLTEEVGCEIIYVTAFRDREDYKKFSANLAWETEVWLAKDPEHLIHLNGDKFLGPYSN